MVGIARLQLVEPWLPAPPICVTLHGPWVTLPTAGLLSPLVLTFGVTGVLGFGSFFFPAPWAVTRLDSFPRGLPLVGFE